MTYEATANNNKNHKFRGIFFSSSYFERFFYIFFSFDIRFFFTSFSSFCLTISHSSYFVDFFLRYFFSSHIIILNINLISSKKNLYEVCIYAYLSMFLLYLIIILKSLLFGLSFLSVKRRQTVPIEWCPHHKVQAMFRNKIV